MPKEKAKEKASVVANDTKKPIPGLGITRDQLIDILKARTEESELKPAFMRYLFDIKDWLNEGSLVTETPNRMIVTKVRMKLLLAASDPDRIKPLIQVFIEEYNKEMVGFERKGRMEGLGALQALLSEGEEERAINIGR